MQELNVTVIAPRERHPLIFKTFDELEKEGSFVLINDHDPKPLYYSFLHEREGQFAWEYLVQGPVEWRVRIAKKRSEMAEVNQGGARPGTPRGWGSAV